MHASAIRRRDADVTPRLASRVMFHRAVLRSSRVARALTGATTSTSSHTARSFASDAIVMRDMEFFAKHGALRPERELGQKFTVNVELDVDLRRAGASDDLSHTVDYARAWEIVRDVVARGQTRITIEAVAEDAARALLSEFPDVSACVVSVDKREVAIEGHLGSLGVRVRRSRNDVSS
jgi:dihydroneopterin aldolase